MKKKSVQQDRCKDTISHINRIIGQLNALKRSIEQEDECEAIALLATSIAKSTDGLRVRTLEGFILHDIVEEKLSKEKQELLTKLLKRFKK